MAEPSSWIMVDGKLNPHAMRALYASGMAEEVISILQGTTYEALAGAGPLLARVNANSEMLERWKANEPPLRYAWCFTSSLTPYELAAYWRRRLLIRGPMERTLWLRYADSRVMERGIEKNVFPDAFWGGVESLQLFPQQGAWTPLSGKQAWEEPDDDALFPLFTFNERQLASLSPAETVL
ncbi:hypothetical protein BWR19_13015 [Halomonas sp. 1513]|nr:DUF4123 domain-containing protein [Halomonas sp. 1513]APX93784.1 hypothetical protein BWR19_13015 [Halomonas sp. 1513]